MTTLQDLCVRDSLLPGDVSAGGMTTLQDLCVRDPVLPGDVSAGGMTTLQDLCVRDPVLPGDVSAGGMTTLQDLCVRDPVLPGDVSAGGMTTLQDLCVRDPVLPGDDEDTSEAAKVKTVQFLLLSCIRCPDLTTVAQCAENTCLVHMPGTHAVSCFLSDCYCSSLSCPVCT